MAVYKAPLKDIQFVLNEVLDVSSLAKLPGYEDATPDTVAAILEEAAKLCENVLFPLNRSGDEEGCTYENGVVRTPKGFKEAYNQFREGGWTATTCDPEVWRAGAAGHGGLRRAGNVHRVEPGLLDVSRA
jgi:alkylation response protein AidB-like acyl-CoA dehydrogenase